jgi:hypothetical protein
VSIVIESFMNFLFTFRSAHTFIMLGILNVTLDSSFLADLEGGGVWHSCHQESQTIRSFEEISV